ncbi:aldo-keto reductase family 1 member C18-like [Stegodyphus dumicola]|uniref:aldo-keto reductase family 1 member C18-like n=1 Tax=Stegodyphus dumicola TaxID=202533 RepID=UPI0015B07CB5|nr:aldo-keto reductase family 1 member C18-like [Stegodyphus dumicola]
MTLSIALVAYSPLGSPGLPDFAQKYFGIEYHQERLLDDELLKSVARKHKRSPAQILLRYLIERGIAVIPKSCSPTRIEENIQVFDFSIEKEDLFILKSLGGKNLRYFSFDFFKKYPYTIYELTSNLG